MTARVKKRMCSGTFISLKGYLPPLLLHSSDTFQFFLIFSYIQMPVLSKKNEDFDFLSPKSIQNCSSFIKKPPVLLLSHRFFHTAPAEARGTFIDIGCSSILKVNISTLIDWKKRYEATGGVKTKVSCPGTKKIIRENTPSSTSSNRGTSFKSYKQHDLEHRISWKHTLMPASKKSRNFSAAIHLMC